MNELALFAGIGGGILGGKLLGWRTVCAVEREAYAAAVLAQRQNDGCLEPFPIWSDVETFDGSAWRGIVDVVSGGFPCQDISVAGRGAGISGKKSSLWKQMARIISEVRPKYVFVENTAALASRGLGTVLGDLSEIGFDAVWDVISAADVGAPHLRKRLWILAYSRGERPGPDSRGSHENEGQHERRPKKNLQQLNGDGQGDSKRHVSNTNSLRKSQSEGSITDEPGRTLNLREASGKSGGAKSSQHQERETTEGGGFPSGKIGDSSRPLDEYLGGKLNPSWVAWLMGFPIMWTELELLEMHRFQKWLEQHGSCSGTEKNESCEANYLNNKRDQLKEKIIE